MSTLECMLVKGVAKVGDYNENHIDFPMTKEHLAKFASNWLAYALVWGFAASLSNLERDVFGRKVCEGFGGAVDISMGSSNNLTNFFVKVEDGELDEWVTLVPKMEIESSKVVSSDVVVTTSDTCRHFDVLRTWINTRKPVVLCGPPGSGKSMTLTAVLQSLPDIILAPLNFSSSTTPGLILKTFHQYCEYKDTPKGVVLQPLADLGDNKWLVVFCDEINLPEADKYGTQRVISFMRQLTEHGGFYRKGDNVWVTLQRIQFVGGEQQHIVRYPH